MFAVIKSGGRQYKVSVGQKLEVNRLPYEDGEQIRFEEVLLISDEETSMVGTPHVANAAVLATILGDERGEKLIVFRYKSKKRVRHRRGHRQELTALTIDDIVADGKSLITGKALNAEDETPAEEVSTPDAEVETPVEAEKTPTVEEAEPEKKTSRRRRTAKVEEVEKAESEETGSKETESEEK